ncbi:MAG: type IV pilus modification PilV family protein [bacterium]
MESTKHRGYLLIEVMMTILLLTIGVTGFTSSQLNALRLNLSAQVNSDIALSNAAIFDRLRLYPDAASRGELNIRFNTDPLNNQNIPRPPHWADIAKSLISSGVSVWIEVSCQTGSMTVCEVCFENTEAQHTNPFSANERSERPVFCNQQIIM